MGSKNRKKDVKSSKKRASLTKISNKTLNKLAKRGKLDKRMKKKDLHALLKERTTGVKQQLKVTDPSVEVKEEREEEDIPLVEDDLAFFGEGGRGQFLTSIDLDDKPQEYLTKRERQRRKRQREDEEEEAEDDEKLSEVKVTKLEKVGRQLLPKILSDGTQVYKYEKAKEGEDDYEEDDEEEEGEESEEEEEPFQSLSPEEQKAQMQKERIELEKTCALLAVEVVSNPEEHVKNLKKLFEMMVNPKSVIPFSCKSICMETLRACYKDVIPTYRIRAVTEKEKEHAIKQSTQALRNFEETLLTCYKTFLTYLEALIRKKSQQQQGKKGKRKQQESKQDRSWRMIPEKGQAKLKVDAIRCMCELLVAHPHFNHRTDIINTVGPLALSNSTEMSNVVCEHFKLLFRADKDGLVTLEVARLLGRLIKQRNFNVKPKVLDTFLALKINEVMTKDDLEEEKKKKDDRSKLSRKEKQRSKQKKALERELKSATAAIDHKKRLRTHTEIIDRVFLVYFRILKQAPKSALLKAVLAGLCKFAHLINVDFFYDLFNVLGDIMEADRLDDGVALHCLKATFTVIGRTGVGMSIDGNKMYCVLYRVLRTLPTGATTDLREYLPITLDCLNLMLTRRRDQVPWYRVLAFIKRLAMLCMRLPPHGILASLATIKDLMRLDSRSEQLLDTDKCGSGEFDWEMDDPEYCNAPQAVLHELVTLKSHYHPVVCEYARYVLAGCPAGQMLDPVLARKSPEELFNDYDSSEMKFNPPPPPPKPLLKMQNRKKIRIPTEFDHFVTEFCGKVDTAAENSELDDPTLWSSLVKKTHKGSGDNNKVQKQNPNRFISLVNRAQDTDAEDVDEPVEAMGLGRIERILCDQETTEEKQLRAKQEDGGVKAEVKDGGKSQKQDAAAGEKPGKKRFTNKFFKNRKNQTKKGKPWKKPSKN